MQVREHRRDLDLGILEQLLDPLLLAGAVLHEGSAVAGEVAQPADLGRLHLRWPAHATLDHLRQPDRVGRSVFALPGTFFTSRALTSQQPKPSASRR